MPPPERGPGEAAGDGGAGARAGALDLLVIGDCNPDVMVVGRESKAHSLFDPAVATFDEDRGAYDQKDAAGFIKLNALRLRIEAQLARKLK